MSKFKGLFKKKKDELFTDLFKSNITFTEYGKFNVFLLILSGIGLIIVFPIYLPFAIIGAICDTVHRYYMKWFNKVKDEFQTLSDNYDNN